MSKSPLGFYSEFFNLEDDFTHEAINQLRAWHIVMFGAPHFFVPRSPATVFFPGHARKASFYDNRPISETLTRLVDFDRLNGGEMRFSVGAVDVRSGNFTYFEPGSERIGVEHIMASGSLPPAFPATEVGGNFYWDGGLVSNTPLEWVLDSQPRRDTLAFQVDLWSARGALPRDIIDVEVRHRKSSIRAAPARRPITTSMCKNCAMRWRSCLGNCRRN